jgi:hypothetical protein
MARKEHDETTLDLDDRPRVRDVIAIVRRMQLEDRWHRRIRRTLARWRRFDWAAWRFRMRMRFARIRNEDVSPIVQREVRRVEGVIARLNIDVPRERHVRGKVYIPRGLFALRDVDIPDTIDIVWPTAPRQAP